MLGSASMRWLPWFLLLGASCGPIEYITVVTFEASRSVNEASASRANELAPYEYTAAVEYLHKAREVGGYARYHQAIEFGKKARDFGAKATKIAREKAARPAEAND
jgi:hypothetical protein